MTNEKSGTTGTPTDAERDASKAAMGRLQAREQDRVRVNQEERFAAPEIWNHEWSTGGVRHRLAASTGEFRYRRSGFPGLRAIIPTGDEPTPGTMSLGVLEMIGGVAVGVSEVAHGELARLLNLHADAFKEANDALEADGAPPVQTVPAMAGALVRILRERREYAESYRKLQECGAMEVPGREALNTALGEVGEFAGGLMLATAAKVIRGLSTDVKARGEAGRDLSIALDEAGEKTSGRLLVTDAARAIRRLLAERLRGTLHFHAVAGDRPELRALEGVPVLDALYKLARMFNAAENAEHAEGILANTLTAYEDAVSPVRRTGDTVLDTVQRLVDEQVTRDAEAYDAGAFLGSPLPSERERIMAAEKLHARTLKNVALCHATLEDALKLIAPGVNILDTGKLRRFLDAAMACLETLPFELHVDKPTETAPPRLVEERVAASPVPVPRRHYVIIGDSKTACEVQLLKPITGRSYAADEIDGVMVRWSTDADRVTCPECIEVAALGPVKATAPKLDPVFEWSPLVGGERWCTARFESMVERGVMRPARSGATWHAWAFGQELAARYPGDVPDVPEPEAMAWVQDRLTEKLVARMMERALPPWTKPMAGVIPVSVDVDGEALARALKSDRDELPALGSAL